MKKTAKKTTQKKGIDHKKVRSKQAESRLRATQQLDGVFVIPRGKRKGQIAKASGPKLSLCDIRSDSGNSKLRKTCEIMARDHGWICEIASWALPAAITCGGAKDCLVYCLALQGRYMCDNVSDLRFRNLISLERSEDSGGIEAMADLLFHQFKLWVETLPAITTHAIMRLHDSGDFYSQSYIDAMAAAVERTKDHIENHPRLKGLDFRPYAYTKSLHLELSGLRSAGVQLVQSHGGRFDKLIDPALPIAQVGTKESQPPAGWKSGQNEEHMDTLALLGYSRIWLEYHGTYSQPTKLEDRDVQLFNITERKAG